MVTEHPSAAAVTKTLRPYRQRIEHIFRAHDMRSVATGCPRNCRTLLDQLALRARVGSCRTYNRDHRALQAMTTALLGAGQPCERDGRFLRPMECLPTSFLVPGWFLLQARESVAELDGLLASASYAGMVERAEGLVCELSDRVSRQPVLQEAGAHLALMAGLPVFSHRSVSGPTIKQSWIPINRSSLERLLAALPPGTEEDGFLKLICSDMPTPGFVRFMARSAWLTGMRAGEMFGCRLFQVQENRRDATSDHPASMREFPAIGCTDPARDLALARRGIAAGETALLTIRTSKTRCGSARIDNRMRTQRLDGISADDLTCLWMTAQLRSLMLTQVRKRSLGKYCSRLLGQASESVFPDREHRITLHILRHAFVDACRSLMRLDAVAALTGHTSAVSARHYGGRYTRYSRYRKGTRWLPRPDPAYLQQIQAAWDRTPHPPASEAEIDPPAAIGASVGCKMQPVPQ